MLIICFKSTNLYTKCKIAKNAQDIVTTPKVPWFLFGVFVLAKTRTPDGEDNYVEQDGSIDEENKPTKNDIPWYCSVHFQGKLGGDPKPTRFGH